MILLPTLQPQNPELIQRHGMASGTSSSVWRYGVGCRLCVYVSIIQMFHRGSIKPDRFMLPAEANGECDLFTSIRAGSLFLSVRLCERKTHAKWTR